MSRTGVGTTTISTIALQSGSSRLVIALLQSGGRTSASLQLRILEMSPEFGWLGKNHSEAESLQQRQQEVMTALQSKQSPVEELLRQADQMILTQQPRAEVYSAMAESLGTAWRDINNVMEERKVLLDINQSFQGHLKNFLNKSEELKKYCLSVESLSCSPSETLAILNRARRSMLECSVYALQEGETLLSRLHSLCSRSDMDSRMEIFQISLLKSIEQELHDRRVEATGIYEGIRDNLNRKLKSLDIAVMIDKYSNVVQDIRRRIETFDTVEKDIVSCQEQLKKLLIFEREIQEASEKCLKLVSQCEGLDRRQYGDISMECSLHAYDILHLCTELLQLVEIKTEIISTHIALMQDFNNSSQKLKQIEIEMESKKETGMLSQDFSKEIKIILESFMLKGQSCLDNSTSMKSSARQLMQEIQDSGTRLISLCSEARNREWEAFKMSSEAVSEGVQHIQEEIEESFKKVTEHNLEQLNRLQDSNSELARKINKRILEVSGLRSDCLNRGRDWSQDKRREAELNLDRLESVLETNRQLIGSRLTVTEQLISFVRICGELRQQMNKLETLIADEKQRWDLTVLEQSRILIQQLYLQVCNIGKNLKEEMNQNQNESIRTFNQDFMRTVETQLEIFTKKQTTIIERWNKAENRSKEERKNREYLEGFKDDAEKMVKHSEEISKEGYSLFKPNSLEVNIDQELLVRTNMTLTRIVTLIEEGQSFSEKLKEDDRAVTRTLVDRLESKRKQLQEKVDSFDKTSGTTRNILKSLSEMDRVIETLNIRSESFDLNEIERKINEFNIKKDLVKDKLQAIVAEIKENILELQKLQSFEDDILKIRTDMQNKMNNFQIKWTEELGNLKEASKFLNFEENNRKFCIEVNEHLQNKLTLGRGDGEKIKEFSKANSDLKKNVKEIILDGKNLIKEIPTFEKKIVSCISKLESIQQDLEKAGREINDDLLLHQKFQSKIEDWSKLSKLLAKQMMLLSSKMTSICLASSSNDLKETISKAESLKTEIKSFVMDKKHVHNEISSETKSLTRRIYGDDSIEPVKELEDDITENFKTMESYMERLESLKSELRNKQKEAEITLKLRQEAEMMAAKLAQERAEAARIEAENKEKLKKSESQNTQTEVEPPPRPPSPEREPRPVAPIFSLGLSDLVITEGVPCRLTAEVSGVPVPKITWFKDGIPVEKNTDYISQFQGGTCSLTIEETMKEDSANWSVRASNKAGYSESHAKLTVKEVKPVVQEYPPLFVRPLEDCEAKEGSSVELSCKIGGNPFPAVSWYRNGVCIDKSKNYNIGGENDDCVLRIEKIHLEDSSTFTCKIQNSHGAAMSGAKLVVQPVEPVVVPQFEVPLSNIVAKAGKEILLECSITGTPTPSITWFKDNKAIKPSKDIEISFDGKNAALRVVEAFPKHAGHYVCKGYNTVGETTSNSTVYFKSTTPELSDSEAGEELKGRSKPAFYVPLSNSEATEAEDVTLECVIVAKEGLEVSWFHNNQMIRETKNIRFQTDDNCYRLCLSNLDVSQAGKYQVVAKNSLGESCSSCNLQVKNARTSSSSQTHQYTHQYTHKVTNSKKLVEPKFTTPVQGKMVEAGESLVLEGTVSGCPQPSITWYRGTKELTSDAHMKVEVQNNKTILTIAKVTQKDGGQYRCRAQNQAGTAESLADVIVKRETSAPVFLKRLTSKYLNLGQKLVMEVETGGSPVPEIHWYFNEKEISHGKSVSLRRQGAYATLLINSVQLENNGQYAVKATNSAGEAVCVANVVVEREASPPPRPPQPQYESDGESRSDTPLSRSSTSARELGPESQALRTLATFKRHSKPLPDLLPFPFKPDEKIERPRRNNTKVPKPSRFVPGEMYHSDYESDFEGNIGVRWRSAVSDTEDVDPRYRKVQPLLSRGFSQRSEERKPSPPCPHQWESHEEIDKLEHQLKTKRNLLRVVRKYDRKEEVVSEEKSDINTKTTVVSNGKNESQTEDGGAGNEGNGQEQPEYYEAFAVVKSHSNISIKIDQASNCGDEIPPPLPAKNKLNVLTPSASMRSVDSGSFSDETSFTLSSLSSQSTVQTVRSSNYVRVREKVRHLERKVEEDYLKQALAEELGSSEQGTIRPDRIPGAVRVLPTPTPPGSRASSRAESRAESRKNSLTRSNSTDYTSSLTRGAMMSPVNTLTRSVQPSPLFGRKYQDNPPPMFIPPSPQPESSQSGPGWRSVSCQLERSQSSARNVEDKEPTPPTKFERPDEVSGKLRPEIDLEKTVEEIKKYRNQSSLSNGSHTPNLSRTGTSSSLFYKSENHLTMTSPPPLETVNDTSRFLMMQRRSRSRDILSEDESDSRLERLKSPGLVMEATKSVKRGSIDGYEADTDTLKSRKGSVRNIANIFERREITNPSPVPRPSSVQSQRFRTPEPGSFTTSTAYVAPRWASETEQTIKSETKMIRINQNLVSNLESTQTTTTTSESSGSYKFHSMFSLSVPDSGTLIQPPTSPNTATDREANISPCIFRPKKFVPGKSEEDALDLTEWTDQTSDIAPVPPKWLPESVSELCRSQPEYKSVQPSLSRTVTPNNV